MKFLFSLIFAGLLALAPTVSAQPLPVPSPSGTIPATTAVTLSWGTNPGAVTYAVRLIDQTDPAARDPRNNCQSNPPQLYLCVDGLVGTSYSAVVVPGHTYSYWVHWVPADGVFSEASGTVFTVTAAPVSGDSVVSGGLVLAYDAARFMWVAGVGGGTVESFLLTCTGPVAASVVVPDPSTRALLVKTVLTAPGVYACSLVARNSAGVSPASNTVTLELRFVVVVPAAPTLRVE